MKIYKDIEPINDKGELHGLRIRLFNDGKVQDIIRFIDGIQSGIVEGYYTNGLSWKVHYDMKKLLYLESYIDNKIHFNI